MESQSATVSAFPTKRMKTRAGLVLTGGGARAAYQVGVVKAVRDLLGNPVKNPFPIVCGTSAGAINAATLAVFADNFSRPNAITTVNVVATFVVLASIIPVYIAQRLIDAPIEPGAAVT